MSLGTSMVKEDNSNTLRREDYIEMLALPTADGPDKPWDRTMNGEVLQQGFISMQGGYVALLTMQL